MFRRDKNTRISRDDFKIMRPKKEIRRNTVKFRGPGLRKNLPQDMKRCYSEEVFKTKIRKYKERIAEIMYDKGTLLNQNKDRNYSYVYYGQLIYFSTTDENCHNQVLDF